MKNIKRGKRTKYWGVLIIRVGMLIFVLYVLYLFAVYIGPQDKENKENHDICDSKTIEPEQKTVDTSGCPDELLELLQKNPETKEFVLNYPAKKDFYSREGLKELKKDEIPLLLQWDERWGYYQYGDNVMGLTGCGPTCLSMVASFLLQNPELTPIYMADYATKNGYCVPGSGTSWEFMSKGAMGLGLQVWEVPLSESRVKEYLRQGNPIICIMGPGEFTDNGHFIVLTGLSDNKIKIHDSNSRERSNRLWGFEEIKGQIRNMWVYFKA